MSLKNVLVPAKGGAPYKEFSRKIIRFIRHGCTNRPFFHISVQELKEEQYGDVIEQVGVYDPMPNKYNEKLVALNFDRIQHWIDQGVLMSLPVKKLLGLSGYYPIHPRTYNIAWNRRRILMETIKELEALKAKNNSETENQETKLSDV